MGGWKTMTVAELAAPGPDSLATGPFGSSISSRFFRNAGVPVIRGGNLSTDSTVRLKDENLVFLDPEKASEFSRSTVRPGDLVFTCWGTINQVGLIDESAAYEKYVISNKQMKLTPDASVADPEFLYYLFSSTPMQQEILEGWIGSSIPGFNLTRLKSLELELPPPAEQRRIAQAISDAEGVEVALNDAITKRQAMKQGMMQQLLAGKTRIGGFTGEWTKVAYRDILAIERGEVFAARDERTGGTIPVIAAGQSPAAFTFRANREGPVLTISASGASAGYVAFHRTAIFASDCSTISSSGRYDLLFIYYGLKLQQERIYRTQAGGAQPHVHAKDIYPLELALPPSVDEQRAIAEVLREIDDQIETLAQRMAKACQIKQGMMQQLLSGRTRLVPDEVLA